MKGWETSNPPPPIISLRWQEELIRVAGCAPNGLPMLRLVWAPTATVTPHTKTLRYFHHWVKRLVDWTAIVRDVNDNYLHTLSFPPTTTQPEPVVGEGEFARSPRPNYVREVISPHRWIVEQYFPADLLAGWEEKRKEFQEAFNEDAMGPLPDEGFYWFGFHMIYDHEGACCKRSSEKGLKCYGIYRAPSDIDVLYCEAIWAANRNDTWRHSWTDSPSRSQISELVLNWTNSKKDEAAKERSEMRDAIHDALSVSKKRLTSAGHGLDLVRYHDLGKALTEKAKNAKSKRAYSGPTPTIVGG